MAKDILFKFQSLEITSTKLMMSLYEEKTVVPLQDIKSYHLKWYLHEPTFGKKWWYLVLTVDLVGPRPCLPHEPQKRIARVSSSP
jgi:hypothetical protein